MVESTDLPYELSAHARAVLDERSIPLTWVARTLERPDWVERDRRDPQLQHALARIAEYDGRVLRVVYNGQPS